METVFPQKAGYLPTSLSTLRHKPEDQYQQPHRSENLRSHIISDMATLFQREIIYHYNIHTIPVITGQYNAKKETGLVPKNSTSQSRYRYNISQKNISQDSSQLPLQRNMGHSPQLAK
jgi:hypothetical protein